MQSPIKVILVEDHPEYRESIAMVIAKADDIELTNQFGTAEQALHAIQYDKSFQAPDLILLDLNLPGLNGIEMIPWLKQYISATNIMMLTQSDAEADVVASIQAGASGYLLKSSSRDEITSAIRLVVDGGAAIDEKVAKFILKNFHKKGPSKREEINLSEREIEVLTLLGEGLVKKEIANNLCISVHTVGNHMRNIYEKLQVKNAPAAITKAFRSGILET
ncbi:MAG: response regulator [Opitutaceae bacterium]